MEVVPGKKSQHGLEGGFLSESFIIQMHSVNACLGTGSLLRDLEGGCPSPTGSLSVEQMSIMQQAELARESDSILWMQIFSDMQQAVTHANILIWQEAPNNLKEGSCMTISTIGMLGISRPFSGCISEKYAISGQHQGQHQQAMQVKLKCCSTGNGMASKHMDWVLGHAPAFG